LYQSEQKIKTLKSIQKALIKNLNKIRNREKALNNKFIELQNTGQNSPDELNDFEIGFGPITEEEICDKEQEKDKEKSKPVIKTQTPTPFAFKEPKKVKNKTANKEMLSYTVKKGDSLSSISRKCYGSSRYYKFLFEENRKQLPYMKALKPGQILKIPANPKK
jgi:nucleoid-associated protein YgaU